jgi:hypothetical protein
MSTKLQRFTRGQAPTLLDAGRANELVDAINGLLQSTGKGGIKIIVEGSGRLVISGEELEKNIERLIGEGGGEFPEGFEEETLDVVEDNNKAGKRVFLTKAVAEAV